MNTPALLCTPTPTLVVLVLVVLCGVVAVVMRGGKR